MAYRLLDELALLDRDGRPVELPEPRFLRVFAALLINANRRMSKEDLMRAGWGLSAVGEGQLHKAISRIREMLALAGHHRVLATHQRYGYELRVGDDELDMLVFRRLLREAEEAGTDGRLDDEIVLLRRAIGLWQSPRPWTNVPGDVFRGQADDLVRRRKRAATRLFELEMGRGRYDRVLNDLSTLAAYHPTDRRLSELAMLALYRAGNTSEALAVCERHTTALEEETATRPESSTLRLGYAISEGDDATVRQYEAALLPRPAAVEPVAVRMPRELPPAPARFVGRESLVAEAQWLLGRADRAFSVVVVSGPGGFGKTALALRVAQQVRGQYPDGQLYAELGGMTPEPAASVEVVAQFLRALGVSTVPESRIERLSLYRTILADRRIMVVLDDARDEDQVRDLIPGSATCGVLVTARSRLPDLGGVHHLPPLELLDPALAMELFVGVVRGAGVPADPDDGATRRVVELCAGLPLAICIAAALRVRDEGRPIAELADRLESQGPEAFEYGERSVARSIGAGLERLSTHGRRLFLCLGLVRLTDFGLWSAAAVLDGFRVDAAGALSELITSFLIVSPGATTRYRFHELTREYALRRATYEVPGQADQVAVAEQAYRALLTLARRAHRDLYGGDFEVVHSAVPDWAAPAAVLDEVDRSPLDWFEAERRNIRAAVTHCAQLGLTELCWDLAVSAHEFYTIRGYHDDWYATHEIALEACQAAGNGRGEGIVLAALGQSALVASRRAGTVSGRVELERAVELLTAAGDRHGLAIAQRTLANALRRSGQLVRPLRLFQEALGNFQASGDRLGAWQALRFIGVTHLALGQTNEALDVLRRAQADAAEFGEGRPLAQASYWLGQAYLTNGNLAGAEAAFTTMLDIYGDDPSVGHAYALHGFGDLARLRGDVDRARTLLDTAAEQAHAGDDAVLEGRVHLSVAALERAQGKVPEQLGALARAAKCFAGNSTYLEAQAVAATARAEEARGNPAGARTAWALVNALYADMSLPEEDRIYRQQPGPDNPGM